MYFLFFSELQITLHLNSSITVVYTKKPEEVHVFSGNFTDGYRHFFQATFEKGQEIRVVIDSDRQYFGEDLELYLEEVENFRFGARFEEDNFIDAYHGCISSNYYSYSFELLNTTFQT